MRLTDAIKQEQELAIVVQKLKKRIVDGIQKTPIQGTAVICENIALVPCSQLCKSQSFAAESFISIAQARIVSQALAHVSTVSTLVGKIREMVETHKIKIGCNVHSLNDTTIEILKNYLP